MNNPPAFPVQSIYIEDQETNSRGMTLRDYFAAKAMQAIINETSINVGPNAQADDLWNAKVAYRYADAMLKAREQ